MPEGVDPAQELEIRVTGEGYHGDTDLDGVAGLTGGGETDYLPSAGWTDEDGQFVILTWGSSTCVPAVENVAAAGATEVDGHLRDAARRPGLHHGHGPARRRSTAVDAEASAIDRSRDRRDPSPATDVRQRPRIPIYAQLDPLSVRGSRARRRRCRRQSARTSRSPISQSRARQIADSVE